jgi:hypothetical protein
VKYPFKIIITHYFKFSNGDYTLTGDPEFLHNIISPKHVATITVGSIIHRPLSIIGQELHVTRMLNSPIAGKTTIKTHDNLDDIVPYLGKLPIIIEGYLPTVQ